MDLSIQERDEIFSHFPEEVEQELERLRRVAAETTDPASLKFKFHFEALVSEFKKLLESLSAVTNVEEQAKYKQAVSGLIGKMSERL